MLTDTVIENVKRTTAEQMLEMFNIDADVRVFTFGGGGAQIASYLTEHKIDGTRIIAINADESIKDIKADKKLIIGTETLGRHKDTNGEIRIAEYIFEQNRLLILEEARYADIVVLIAALGGGMGTGGILAAARYLKDKIKQPIVAIVLKPFSFEVRRREIAEEAVKELDDYADYLFVLDSDSLLKYRNMKLSEAYEHIYQRIHWYIQKIVDIARDTIREKFVELYLENTLDVTVEEIYHEMMIYA